ncbi:MAG: glycosyltransferase family 39 protein [Magnetococcales bacterium]|nr:glycosyltransferase family 39 protein [Magnetococcales bacterium]
MGAAGIWCMRVVGILQARVTPTRVLLVLLAAFLLFSGLGLHDGHDWGCDYAMYLLAAKNLLGGAPYSYQIPVLTFEFPHGANFVLHTPSVGYPLLLAGGLALFGLDFVALKLVNLVFWCFGVLGFYLQARKRFTPAVAVVGAAALLSLHSMFMFKQLLLSDVPAAALLAVALWLFDSWERDRSLGRLTLLALLCGFIILMRPVYTLLFPSLILALLLGWWRRGGGLSRPGVALETGLLVAVALLIQAINVHFSSLGNDYLGHGLTIFRETPLKEWVSLKLGLVGNEVVRLNVLLFGSSFISSSHAVLLGLIALGFFPRLSLRRIAFMEIFVLAYLVAIIILSPWGLHNRLTLPLVFPAMIYLFHGLEQSVAWARRLPFVRDWRPERLLLVGSVLVLAVMLQSNVHYMRSNWHFNPDVVLKPDFQQLVAWIRRETVPGEGVFFDKPHPLVLFSDRPVFRVRFDPRGGAVPPEPRLAVLSRPQLGSELHARHLRAGFTRERYANEGFVVLERGP